MDLKHWCGKVDYCMLALGGKKMIENVNGWLRILMNQC